MARLAISAALLLSTLTTHAAQAQEQPDADTVNLAASAGLDPVELLGAANSTHLSPADYLALSPLWTAGGERAVPVAPPLASGCGWPICGALGRRLYCLEGAESHHNGAAVNPRSGAAGYLQWMPSTARTWGVQIGNRASEWNGAARVAAQGEPFFRSQWPVTSGWC